MLDDLLATSPLPTTPTLPSVVPDHTLQLPPQPPAGGMPGGSGFGDTLKQLVPMILAGIAGRQGGPRAAAGALRGLARAAERRRLLEAQAAEQAATEEERQFRRRQYAQQQQERAAAFLLDAQDQIGKLPDAASRARALEMYEEMGTRVFGLPPGSLRHGAIAPLPDTAKADAQEATRVLGELQRQYGDQFDALLEMGATVPFKGKPTPIRDLQALTGVAVSDPSGAPVARKKPTPAPTYNEDWYIAEALAAAEEKNDGRPLTRGQKLQAAASGRQRWSSAGREPKAADASVDAVGKRQAETWRANQLAALEQRRRPSGPVDAYGRQQNPGLNPGEYRAERDRIEQSYREMLTAAGVPPPPAPPIAPARLQSPAGAERMTGAGRGAGPGPATSPPATAPVNQLAEVLRQFNAESDPDQKALLKEQLRRLRAQVP